MHKDKKWVSSILLWEVCFCMCLRHSEVWTWMGTMECCPLYGAHIAAAVKYLWCIDIITSCPSTAHNCLTCNSCSCVKYNQKQSKCWTKWQNCYVSLSPTLHLFILITGKLGGFCKFSQWAFSGSALFLLKITPAHLASEAFSSCATWNQAQHEWQILNTVWAH